MSGEIELINGIEKKEYQRTYMRKYRDQRRAEYNEYMKHYLREYKKNKKYSEKQVLDIIKTFLEQSKQKTEEIKALKDEKKKTEKTNTVNDVSKTTRKKRSKKVVEDSSTINKFDMEDFILKKIEF